MMNDEIRRSNRNRFKNHGSLNYIVKGFFYKAIAKKYTKIDMHLIFTVLGF